MEQTGNQTLQTTESLSNDDLGQVLTGLHALGLPDDKIQGIMGAIEQNKTVAENRPAEMEVLEWEPLPALESDNTFTFGAGKRLVTVNLKILPGEYYVVKLLPWLQEWTAAVYRDESLSVLKNSAQNPIQFILGLVKNILARPNNDRVKISFYQAAAETFSTPDAIITPEFYAICPPDQQYGAIRKLVETNHGNFTAFWGDAPLLLKRELSLLYMTIIKSIQKLNASVIHTIEQMTMGITSQHLSGGLPDTGADGSGDLQETSQAST